MSITVEGSKRRAAVMGLTPGMTIQELGWDEDVDHELREDIMDEIDAEFVDEALEAVDIVLLWWRDEDGDIGDGLMDALIDLSDEGQIWLMTPKVGRSGHIEAADIQDAAKASGLTLTNPLNISDEWLAQKVVRPKNTRRA